MNFSKNIINDFQIIKNIKYLYPFSTGYELFKKFNDTFYMKNIKAGSNITINETTNGEIVISAGNSSDNLTKILVEGVSNNNEIITILSAEPIFLNGTGFSNILLNFNSIVNTSNEFVGIFNVEDDIAFTGNHNNLSIRLNNTGKTFSYVFEIISKSLVTYSSPHTITVMS